MSGGQKRFIVDSAQRDAAFTSGTTPPAEGPEDYTYTLTTPIQHADGVELIGAALPKTVYPIIAGFNDTINFDYNSSAFSAVITPKSYSGTELATELASQMNAAATAGGDITVTYDDQTNKLTYGVMLNDLEFIAFATTPHAEHVLGGVPADITAPGTSEAPAQVDLSYPRYLLLDVEFEGGADNTFVTKNNSHTFIVHYADSNFIDLEWWTAESDFKQLARMSDVNIQRLSIRWRPPDREAEAGFSFSQVNHQLMFRAV